MEHALTFCTCTLLRFLRLLSTWLYMHFPRLQLYMYTCSWPEWSIGEQASYVSLTCCLADHWTSVHILYIYIYYTQCLKVHTSLHLSSLSRDTRVQPPCFASSVRPKHSLPWIIYCYSVQPLGLLLAHAACINLRDKPGNSMPCLPGWKLGWWIQLCTWPALQVGLVWKAEGEISGMSRWAIKRI